MSKVQLRQYQQEAIDSILNEPYGSKLILALAVGLGKTFTAAQIAVQLEEKLGRPIRVGFLARQRQLVYQASNYFPNKSVGIEMGKDVSQPDDDVVVATVQSLYRRLDKFPSDHFDLLITDECFTGDVEVLTEDGFVRFDELGDQMVAQVHEDLRVEYVVPSRKIKKEYNGELVRSCLDATNRLDGRSVYLDMTPGHMHAYYDLKANKIDRVAIKDFKNWDYSKRTINYLTSSNDSERRLTPMERLYIAIQADGTIAYEGKESNIVAMQLVKKRKIDRFIKLCDDAGVEYRMGVVVDPGEEFPNRNPKQNIYINIKENPKILSNVFKYDFTYTLANEFIDELVEWDGHRRIDRPNSVEYSSVEEENVDFVNYVAFVAGYNTGKSTIDRGSHRRIIHTSYLSKVKKQRFKAMSKFNIGTVPYSGFVYCVTVPTSNIIIRRGGHILVTGNCQEAKGKQYEETISYFKTAYTVGLSGTPFRMDGKKLTDGLFDKIVYQKNIKWGIQNGYLCDVEAVRCFVDYDLSNVRTSGGDFNITDLEEAMTGSEHAIAEAYYKYSNNKPTLVFATGVKHANDIASLIEGAEVIVGSTPQEERDRIFTAFQEKEIPCIVSVEVMTQGVDLPISTVGIFAKPTKSVGRYQQQVGRILRTHPEKEKALIVDCIGSSSLGLCTAPNLIGINLDKVPEKKLDELEGDLMDMIDLAEELSDIPTSWIRNSKAVDLWAKDNNYDTDKVNYFQMPDGRMVVSLPERAKIVIPAPDMLGKVNARDIKGMSKDLHEWGLDAYGDVWDMQRALNAVNANLKRNYGDSSMLWDLKKVRSWGNDPATEKQMKIINRKLKDEAPTNLTKFEASQVLNRIKTK